METETRTTVQTILLCAAILAMAAAGILLAPKAESTTPDYQPPAACAQAVDLGYRMETMHGQLVGTQAALNIAASHGWKRTAAKVEHRLAVLQVQYLDLSGQRREAAAECLGVHGFTGGPDQSSASL